MAQGPCLESFSLVCFPNMHQHEGFRHRYGRELGPYSRSCPRSQGLLETTISVFLQPAPQKFRKAVLLTQNLATPTENTWFSMFMGLEPWHPSHNTAATKSQPPHSSRSTPATTLQPQHSSHNTPATIFQSRQSSHHTPVTTFQPQQSSHDAPATRL